MTLALMAFLTGCGLWQRETGAARIGPQRPPTHPRADGPVETIGRGEIDGEPWKLTAYRSNDGICVDLHTRLGSSGGCGFEPLRGDLAMSGVGWTSDLPEYAQLEGRVSDRVAKVTGRSGDGPAEELPLHDSERFDMTWFVAFAPTDADYELTAYDDDGEMLTRKLLTRTELDPER